MATLYFFMLLLQTSERDDPGTGEPRMNFLVVSICHHCMTPGAYSSYPSLLRGLSCRLSRQFCIHCRPVRRIRHSSSIGAVLSLQHLRVCRSQPWPGASNRDSRHLWCESLGFCTDHIKRGERGQGGTCVLFLHLHILFRIPMASYLG